MDRLTFDELKDNLPNIIAAIAEAIASDDAQQIAGLLVQAPKQGLSRFHLNCTLVDVCHEDRLLRGVIVMSVEEGLGRQLSVSEAASLHATIDIMLQQSVVTLVDEQKVKLRAAAEAELKYLSFLSHDLNNNLGTVTLSLKLLQRQISKENFDPAEAIETIGAAERSIFSTTTGMQRLLERERLRKSDEQPLVEPVDINSLVASLAEQFKRQARAKGLKIAVDVPPNTIVRTDGDLIRLVLQNLLGNAVKYSNKGAIRITAAQADAERLKVVISDEGAGIAADKLDEIFQAFRRGEVHGQSGVGLGLAIASQAAKLLNSELSVKSELGKGTTFTLYLMATENRLT